MPTISVIIPVHDAAPWLGACLDSVLGQTLRDIEAVCVDDGSTDGSATVLAERAQGDSRVKVLTQANCGQGAARNRGLEIAQGEYVYFMDADDELAEPDAFARLVEVMDREKLDMLCFDAETRPDPGLSVSADVLRAASYVRRHDYARVRTGRRLLAEMSRRREFSVSPCLTMLRRLFVEEHRLRFPAEHVFYEDNIFTTRAVLAAERASHRPWRLYVRKVHAGSTIMSAPTLRHLRGFLACYLDVRNLLEDPSWDCPTRKALVECHVQYKLNVRRIMDAHPELVAESVSKLSTAERTALESIRHYPWPEKLANAWRCLRDHGPLYTLKRILFGRRP